MANSDVEIVFHHAGKFENNETFRYHYGQTTTLKIDPDRWSYFEILSILKEMGYRNVKELWYSLVRGPVLEDCMEPLLDDKGACHVVNIAMLNGQGHVYVIHKVCEPEYILELELGVEMEVGQPEVQAVGNVQPEVEATVQVEGVVEVEVEAVAGVDVLVEGEVEVEVEAVADVDVLVEGEVEVEVEAVVDVDVLVQGEVEVEVQAVADVDGVIEDYVEVEIEAVTEVHGAVEDYVQVEVQAVADVDGVIEGEVEVEAEGVAYVEPHVQVEVEGVTKVEGNGVDGQGEGDVNVDEYDVRSWTGSEEDVFTDDGDEVECDIFEASNQIELGGPRGLSESDWESESLNSVVESDNTNDDDRDGYGDFSTFSMPKSRSNINGK
ncbi:hypothetical protein LR48_Vigan03g084100 [Vigna angularis]|uniref:PB1-like domain-containing protein n=1 Tax=Phaseolus angularis TaxID=3914 RepID=A0A0L9U506_PHAAN|nr:hypothetical protein LR48_Vigan03g084100 [Vigna angularis]